MTWIPPDAEPVCTLNRAWWGGWKGTIINAVDQTFTKPRTVRAFTRAGCLGKLEFWHNVIIIEWKTHQRMYGNDV